MNALSCITTTMDGRPCTIYGQHFDACVWGQVEDEADRRGIALAEVVSERYIAGSVMPRRCRGCIPRPAEHGLLCDSCWPKFEAALSVAVDLITHLRSVERGPQSVDGVRVAQGSKVLVPASWQTADQLWTGLASIVVAHSNATRAGDPQWPTATTVIYGGTSLFDGWFSPDATLAEVATAVDDVVTEIAAVPEAIVARHSGAQQAVEFYRKVQTAQHRFPREDAPVALRFLRCRRCGEFAVRDHPPLEQLAERIIRCDACEAVFDPLLVDWNLKLYAQDLWESLTPEERAKLLPDLATAERRVLRQLSRSDIEAMRDKVWQAVSDEVGHADRATWFNTPRAEWNNHSAAEMVELGRGDDVLALLELVAGGAA